MNICSSLKFWMFLSQELNILFPAWARAGGKCSKPYWHFQKLPVKPERCSVAFCSSSQSFLMNSIVQLVCETLSSIPSSSCSHTFKFSYIHPQTEHLSHLYWDLCQYSFKRLPDFKFASFVPPMTVKAELIVSGRCSVYELQTGLQ